MASHWGNLGHIPIASAAAVLGLLLGWSPIGVQLDALAYDYFLRARPSPTTEPAAVLLAIEEESLSSTGGLLRLREPLARALQTIAENRPSVVAIDVVFSEPRTAPEDDALESALAALPNLVLATYLRSSPAARDAGWEEPRPRFKQHAVALGHVHAEPDDDSVCRRVLLAKADGRIRRWAMALEAYRLAAGVESIVETENGLEVGDSVIPATRAEGRPLRITYAPGGQAVARIPLREVLDRPNSAAVVRDKVVFVGVNAVGGPDRFLMTPVSSGQPMAGVEINAQLYATIARGDFLESTSDRLVLLLTLIYPAIVAAIFWRLSSTAAVISAAVVVLAHLVPWGAFQMNSVLAFTPPVAAAWLGWMGSGSWHYLGVRRRLGQAEEERSRYQRAVHYVSHEMRTPLTTIQGSSELISSYNLPEEKQREVGRLIHQESQRLARLIEMFLGVERLSAGQMQLDCKAVSPQQVLQACADRLAVHARRKNVKIDLVEITDEPIWGDSEFLEYACYNLLTNAVKYSPASTSVTVRARHDRDSVLISVEDRGYGMDESELKSIFRKFYRTSRARESGETGSGLGLALVEEIVAQHRGSIEVESRVHEGSRFTLKLPRAAKHAMQEA